MKARKLADNVWEMPRRQGPSEGFLKLTRNPDLPQPARFEPSKQVREDDVWL